MTGSGRDDSAAASARNGSRASGSAVAASASRWATARDMPKVGWAVNTAANRVRSSRARASSNEADGSPRTSVAVSSRLAPPPRPT